MQHIALSKESVASRANGQQRALQFGNLAPARLNEWRIHNFELLHPGQSPSSVRKVRQWTDGLLVSRSELVAGYKAKTQKFDVDHAFQAGKLLLITMTSGPNGTSIYLEETRRGPVFYRTLFLQKVMLLGKSFWVLRRSTIIPGLERFAA